MRRNVVALGLLIVAAHQAWIIVQFVTGGFPGWQLGLMILVATLVGAAIVIARPAIAPIGLAIALAANAAERLFFAIEAFPFLEYPWILFPFLAAALVVATWAAPRERPILATALAIVTLLFVLLALREVAAMRALGVVSMGMLAVGFGVITLGVRRPGVRAPP